MSYPYPTKSWKPLIVVRAMPNFISIPHLIVISGAGIAMKNLPAYLSLALLALGASIFVPLLMQKTIDEGIARRDIPLVWLLVIAQIAIFAGSQLTTSVSGYVVNKLGLRLSTGAVDRYLTKLVSLPLRFFDSRVSSDLIQKTYDQEQTQQFMLQTPTTLLLTVINIAVFSARLLWFNPWIFLGFLMLTLTGLAWEGWMLRRRRSVDYDIRTIQCRNNNNVYELVNGISDLMSLGGRYASFVSGQLTS